MNRRSFITSIYCVTIIAVGAARHALAHPGHTHEDGSPAPAVPAHLRSQIVQLNSGEFKVVRPPVAVAPDDDEIANDYLRPIAPKADRTPIDEPVATCDDGNNTADAVDPKIHSHFSPFAKSLKLRWDDQFYYVGSNGMPDHPMMIGITAWQQQVPLPQKYFDDNAWRIPLHPVPAKEPAMIKGRFLRGAIALGVNGIPIFNPQNNRGDVSYEIGELDEWGGHCGRADDYHYHIVPVHLEKIVGKDQPVAYALDGYPIYGYQDEKAPDFATLDRLSGHKDRDGNYHYHATKTYPYVIGGFYGEVVEREEQVDPQPRAQPVREALPQMRGAKIVEFQSAGSDKYELKYEMNGKPGFVRYAIAESGSVTFTFVDLNGGTKTETYEPGQRRPGGGGGGKGSPGGDRRPPRPGENPPPRPGENRPGENRPPRPGDEPPKAPSTSSRTPLPQSEQGPSKPKLNVRSSAIGTDGRLPREFTCDGAGISPPVEWSDVPSGTKSFAISLWHTAPDQEKSYWLVYDIPADVTKLEKASHNVGRVGFNDKRRSDYDPMCSKGPGLKTYHITVYALSAELNLPADRATRAELLSAVKGKTLAEGTFTFQYQRDQQ